MRLEGAFVNIEHLALSLVGDQTGALRCELKRMRCGTLPAAWQDVWHVWCASLWGLGGKDMFSLKTNMLREI